MGNDLRKTKRFLKWLIEETTLDEMGLKHYSESIGCTSNNAPPK